MGQPLLLAALVLFFSFSCTNCQGNTSVLCPSGYASITTGNTSNATCVACPIGQYTPTSGSSACSPCPYATYTDQVATANSCLACPSGTSTPVLGSSALSNCSSSAPIPLVFRRYPPQVGLTDYTSTVSGQAYGNGQYVITYSTTEVLYYYLIKNMFNGIEGGYGGATAEGGYYYPPNGLVTGYKGEWVALQMPQKISYSYVRLFFSTAIDYRIYGRNSDNIGAGWTMLQDVVGATYTNSVHQSTPLSGVQLFDTLAIVVKTVV